MQNWIKMILYENDEMSLTRLISVIGWIAFLFGSAYMIYKQINWQNYETFATMTAGGGAATQVANKFINSKYNSPAGQFGQPGQNRTESDRMVKK